MPINNAYNGGTLFTRAASECIIRGQNNAPATIDPDTENVGGGICSGITSSWVACLLNANKRPEARDTAKFGDLYSNVLRFQGSYFKELHGTSENHLNQLATTPILLHGKHIGNLEKRTVIGANLPNVGWWASYITMTGHAVGAGSYTGFYHIMDPNYGLFTYREEAGFISDINGLIDEYMNYKGRDANYKAKFILYQRKTGAAG